MDITQTQPPANAPTAKAAPAEPKSAKPEISSDFETFLKMLTTQMQNQDPLNPLDSNDFAVQLATFSGVEQQVRTNDLLQGLGAQMDLMGLSQLAGWVGRDARVAGVAAYQGTPVTLYTDPPTVSQKAEIVVSDASGREVYRGAVPTEAQPVVWNGTDSSGKPVPQGVYDVSLTAYVNDEPIAADPPETYGRIAEARVADGETVLMLEGGVEVSASEVKGLRGG